MSSTRGFLFAILVILSTVVTATCRESDDALPTPAAITPGTTPSVVGDPAFAPLPGAKAYFGELNGGVYQIEIPDNWNDNLVMYMHGSHYLESRLTIDPPIIRRQLISSGYAWAASSYDRIEPNMFGIAADQTAALWDYFARRFGRPKHSFVLGDSMGGGGAIISAERYADRYDGVLSACGQAGATPTYDQYADLVTAGAYAADLPDQEFQNLFLWESIQQRIRPALASDPAAREEFLRIWISLSGGLRPFAVEGFERREDALWATAINLSPYPVLDNSDKTYRFEDWVGVSTDNFNRTAPRLYPPGTRQIRQGEDMTGDIEIPVLLLHTTGDGLVPLSHVQYVDERVRSAGREDLLHVTVIADPSHCGFTEDEYLAAFHQLVRWVESGNEPNETLGRRVWNPSSDEISPTEAGLSSP